jgi:ABC-type tungstate transport system substrate-binding protein
MKLNFRIIAKFCFLLVLIGFFMPICCDQNGFELANSDMVKSSLTVSLYALFISAVAGILLGVVLLFLKKRIPVVTDWLIILTCVLCGLIPYFINRNEYEFQAGLYVILAGYALILITQVVSLIKKET